jgi:hypothetical protein
MNTKRKNRIFHLKTSKFNPDPHESLHHLLIKAVSILSKAVQREEPIGADEDERRVMHHFKHNSAGEPFFGTVCTYTRETNKNVVSLDPNAQFYVLSEVAPPKGAGEERKNEFLDGLMFFCVKGQRVALSGSQQMRAESFEAYLAWLLRKAKVLPDGALVQLCDPVVPVLRKYPMKNVKEVEIRSSIHASADRTPTAGAHGMFKPSGKSWKGLSNLLEDIGAEPPTILSEDPTTIENMEVLMRLRWRYRGKGTTAARTVQAIADSLRNVDDPPVVFRFPDGRQLSAKKFKVARNVSVLCHTGIPDQQDMYNRLDTWLDEQVRAQDTGNVE